MPRIAGEAILQPRAEEKKVSLKDRIFDLVFRGRDRKRAAVRRGPQKSREKRGRERPEGEGFDSRYFIRHRR